MLGQGGEPPAACMAGLTRDAVARLADGHDRSLSELGGGKAGRIVDKMPDNYVHLGLIATLFPDAAIIYCRRDFRDIAVSCWLTGFRSIRWTNAIEHIASRFAQHVRVMDHWRSVLPGRIHEVDYEEIVSDLEAARGDCSRLAGSSGIQPALTSTALPAPFAPQASPRCASRFTRAQLLAGRTIKTSLPICSPCCRRRAGRVQASRRKLPPG